MPKSRPNSSQPGQPPKETESTSWDFVELLHTDIRKIEVAESLRQLGQIRVTDWDFRNVLPAVKRTANREVDVVDLIKRTANYKILDWDFRNSSDRAPDDQPTSPIESVADSTSLSEIQLLVTRLKNFLEYVTVNLIDEPDHAQFQVAEIAPKVFRFKVILVKRDVAMLIGREGFTATAIRTVIKSVAETQDLNVLLQIHSHEEEQALQVKQGIGR